MREEFFPMTYSQCLYIGITTAVSQIKFYMRLHNTTTFLSSVFGACKPCLTPVQNIALRDVKSFDSIPHRSIRIFFFLRARKSKKLISSLDNKALHVVNNKLTFCSKMSYPTRVNFSAIGVPNYSCFVICRWL